MEALWVMINEMLFSLLSLFSSILKVVLLAFSLDSHYLVVNIARLGNLTGVCSQRHRESTGSDLRRESVFDDADVGMYLYTLGSMIKLT